MADIHIDDFYRDVAQIFIQLYASFPRKNILYVEDISGPDEPDEFGLHQPRFQACFSTMLWLAEQGYLRYEGSIGQEALDQASLTQTSFLLLTAPSDLQWLSPPGESGSSPAPSPSVNANAQSNIAQLRGVVKNASSVDINRCVRDLLRRAANAGW